MHMVWDKMRLEQLRAEFSDANGGEIYDEKFRNVAEKIISKNGTRLAPYAGIPTFLSAPYMQVATGEPDFGNLQVAITGIPMDLGVTNRPGSRFGPSPVSQLLSPARSPTPPRQADPLRATREVAPPPA